MTYLEATLTENEKSKIRVSYDCREFRMKQWRRILQMQVMQHLETR